jgi:hypothetical protein
MAAQKGGDRSVDRPVPSPLCWQSVVKLTDRLLSPTKPIPNRTPVSARCSVNAYRTGSPRLHFSLSRRQLIAINFTFVPQDIPAFPLLGERDATIVSRNPHSRALPFNEPLPVNFCDAVCVPSLERWAYPAPFRSDLKLLLARPVPSKHLAWTPFRPPCPAAHRFLPVSHSQ